MTPAVAVERRCGWCRVPTDERLSERCDESAEMHYICPRCLHLLRLVYHGVRRLPCPAELPREERDIFAARPENDVQADVLDSVAFQYGRRRFAQRLDAAFEADHVRREAEGWMSTGVVARRLDVSPGKVRWLCERGHLLGAEHILGGWSIPPEAVEAYLKAYPLGGEALPSRSR
jgi:hypothetical protein